MKVLLAICMMATLSCAWAGEKASPAATPAAVKGEVLEVKDVEQYTYLRLKTRDGETWAAVSKAAVTKGTTVTIENVMVMNNFESRTLKQTFKTILFGTLGVAGGNAVTAAHAKPAAKTETADAVVPKASGANARTVAEVMTRGAVLKDKPVLVRGKVVKFNPQIMGKNWIHLRDGSGSDADGSNDLLVTTQGQTRTGDIVTVKGVVRTDKDFGAGYAYKVLIEEATLQP